MLRFTGPLALTLGKKKWNLGPLQNPCKTNGKWRNLGMGPGQKKWWHWGYRKTLKILRENSFSASLPCWRLAGQKKWRLGVAWNPCENVAKPMVSAGPLPYACGSERIPFSPPAGPLGLSKNLENPWKNQQFRRRAKINNYCSCLWFTAISTR